MGALRLTCSVSVPSGTDFPPEESHPFWAAMEEMADAIALSARERGLDPDTLGHWEDSEGGTLLTQSSDAPREVCYFWVWLPHDAAAQASLLPIILAHLADMRRALPDAEWNAELGDVPIHWGGDRFHLRS